ncbi:MAG: InlB B-repeat-containing protein, partial [Actinomycetota bacterium]
MKRIQSFLVSLTVFLSALVLVPVVAATAATTTSYTAVVSVSPPPNATFVGSGGGDGWGLGFTSDRVFNIFHHSSILQVECHLQADASQCPTNGQLNWPVTITDTTGASFAIQAQPSLWVDQATGRLYVYATLTSTLTAGVVCVDTNSNLANPFCGFTPLSAVGDAPLQTGISNISVAVVVASNFYAVNFVSTSADTHGTNGGTWNKLMCFSFISFAPCNSQPFALTFSGSALTVSSYPAPSITPVGSDVVIPYSTAAGSGLTCWNSVTHATCTGTWPVSVTDSPSSGGGGIPIISAAGDATGYCTRATTECFTLSGSSVTAPVGLPLSSGQPWAGPPAVIGTRVYVPATVNTGDGIDCYDYATASQCAHYPLALANYSLAYSVTVDPNRVGCLWANSDNGSGQIQNFDAYTTGGCGASGERVLISQFVAPSNSCKPTIYQSMKILAPARNLYSRGTVQFQTEAGVPLTGVPTLTFDNTGAVALSTYHFSASAALPQAIINLTGPAVVGATVTVQLTWQASTKAECELEPTPVLKPSVALTKMPDSSVKAVVKWAKPVSDGHAVIAHYTATALPSGKHCVTKLLTCAITGLAQGTNYAFTVTATNKVGTSTPSTTPLVSISPTYRVTYIANGAASGSVLVDAHNPYHAGNTVTVLGKGTLTKPGFNFTGWNSAANGAGNSYSPAATFTMPASSLTLYAQWLSTFQSLSGASPNTLAGNSFTVLVTAGSGTGAVRYSLTGDTTGGACSLSGNVVSASSAGVCTVTVSKAASGNIPLAS